MPSSSATCSTTTVSSSASRSARVSARCSIGRRNSTSRVGVAPLPRTSEDERHLVGLPVVGELRGVLDGVLDQAELVLPAPVDVGDDAERELVEPLPPGRQLRAARLAAAARPGRASRARAGRAGRDGPGRAVVHAAETLVRRAPRRSRAPPAVRSAT